MTSLSGFRVLFRKLSTRQETPLDDRHFPVADRSCTDVWKRAHSAASLDQRDPVTGWLKRTYHGLRKFYLSRFKCVIPAAHRGCLTDEYLQYTGAELEDYYRQAEPKLTVMAPAEVQEIQSEFRQKRQAHSEIPENLMSKSIQSKKRPEANEDLQAQMGRISMVVARYETE